MSGLKVLVVGASVAGPATAYWLAKAGARVTVIERFPKIRPGGQNVDIRTAGVSVMRKMVGMEALVRAHSAEVDGVSFVRDNGRSYGTIGASGDPDQQTLVSEFEIYRGDLNKILFDMTKDNESVKYIFDEQVAALKQSDDGPVTVEFANGSPTSKYDLVVACDGATSRTRAMGFECGVRDHIITLNAWAAYFSLQDDLLQGSRIEQGVSAVGGRAIMLGTDPTGPTRATLMTFQPRSKPDTNVAFRQASAQGTDALKKYVADYYRGVGWRTETVLKQMMDSKDFYASEIVQVKLPSLSNGRFVVVGDAGYAAGPTGGGTSLALSGAYMLAGEICKHGAGDLAGGLRGYEERMQPLLKDMQKIPPFVSSILCPQTAWGVWLRNHIFMLVAWSGIANFVQRYLGAAFANTKEFPLPEYEWVA